MNPAITQFTTRTEPDNLPLTAPAIWAKWEAARSEAWEILERAAADKKTS